MHLSKVTVCLINKKHGELLAPGAEGIKGLTISNAMHLSGWTGETISIIDFSDERFYELLQGKIKNSKVVKEERQVIFNTEVTY